MVRGICKLFFRGSNVYNENWKHWEKSLLLESMPWWVQHLREVPVRGLIMCYHVFIQPLPSNMLEWHYVIEGPPGSPYQGGFYHGIIRFPQEYPYKPPSIRMLTPRYAKIYVDRREGYEFWSLIFVTREWNCISVVAADDSNQISGFVFQCLIFIPRRGTVCGQVMPL